MTDTRAVTVFAAIVGAVLLAVVVGALLRMPDPAAVRARVVVVEVATPDLEGN